MANLIIRDGNNAATEIKATGTGTAGDPFVMVQSATFAAGAAVDGADLTQGITTGAAVTTDAPGTIQQYLRGVIKLLVAKITVIIDQTTPGTTNRVQDKVISRFTTTPTITAGGIYAAGEALGGKFAIDVGSAQFTITKVVVIDNDKELAPIDIVFFSADFTATADNAAFDPSDADLLNCAGHITVPSTAYSSFNDNAEATVVDQPLDVNIPTGTTISGQCVVRSTPTYTAVGDITLIFTVQKV